MIVSDIQKKCLSQEAVNKFGKKEKTVLCTSIFTFF